MTENDLCRELADVLFLRCNDDDSWSQTAREKLLPLIRSYANGLVAAAIEECVKSVGSFPLSVDEENRGRLVNRIRALKEQP